MVPVFAASMPEIQFDRFTCRGTCSNQPTHHPETYRNSEKGLHSRIASSLPATSDIALFESLKACTSSGLELSANKQNKTN